ncbi:NADP-dependent oxidoreductase [Candidatus Curtissbacteria bacterium]|nr:NADP-dependent oxidoreductase [Candidatus Curtissbacteria bacterium]
MKAVQINSYGDVEVLEVIEGVEKPTAGQGQVLVEVYGASINPFDWKLREGQAKDYLKLDFPVIMGGDFAGVVIGLGENVSDFTVGDEIYGQAASYAGGTGAFAQYLAGAVGKIAKKPKNINFLEAASLPLVGISALQALETHIELREGQKILIHGGTGGIGSVAIQIAKALGAYVATTVKSEDFDYVKDLGADEAIDYTSEAFEEKLKDFDAVFDTIGGETTNKSFLVLKKGGVLVSMVGEPSGELADKYGVRVVGQNSEGNTERLERLAELVESGKVKPQIDKVFTLDEVKEAFLRLEKGHQHGKVVLKNRD